ncbi:unnamed protein product [Linum tenue]|uniref:Uncharacterized protein n=1 Tax=Linum tenue TaxID=586396 RepID=A0AAV0NFN6_9ROSI|nr:unnamed protein product [Linum tenue]
MAQWIPPQERLRQEACCVTTLEGVKEPSPAIWESAQLPLLNLRERLKVSSLPGIRDAGRLN